MTCAITGLPSIPAAAVAAAAGTAARQQEAEPAASTAESVPSTAQAEGKAAAVADAMLSEQELLAPGGLSVRTQPTVLGRVHLFAAYQADVCCCWKQDEHLWAQRRTISPDTCRAIIV